MAANFVSQLMGFPGQLRKTLSHPSQEEERGLDLEPGK
jgi:hypothetical protein